MKIKERRKTYSVCEFFLGSTWLTAQQHSDVITLRYLLAPRASWEMKFILTLLQNKWNAVSFLTTYSNILTVFININVNLYFNSLTYLSVICSSEIMSVKQINSQHCEDVIHVRTVIRSWFANLLHTENCRWGRDSWSHTVQKVALCHSLTHSGRRSWFTFSNHTAKINAVLLTSV